MEKTNNEKSVNTNENSNVFAKIGQKIKAGFLGLVNWVKNTAWIQPLLIVAVIFGVILSINPIINWVKSWTKADETYVFYNENKKDMKDSVTIATDASKDRVIVVFYGDENTASKNAQKSLQTFAEKNTTYQGNKITYVTVDCDASTDKIDNTPVTKQQKLVEEFENYYINTDKFEFAKVYNEGANCLKSSAHDTFTLGEDYGKDAIPTPMMARFDKGVLVGVKIDISSSKAADDIENFVLNNPSEWDTFEL